MNAQRNLVMLRGGTVPSDVIASDSTETSDGCDYDEEDLSPDGEIAQRLRAKFAAQEPLPSALFRVQPTEDGRGLGLFADVVIPAGTYLFDYEGEMLERDEYEARYPGAAIAEYVVGINTADGSAVYLDARYAMLSPARYMNHEDEAPNCAMWTLIEPAVRMMVFAASDLATGEELRWDYGEAYWNGREDKV